MNQYAWDDKRDCYRPVAAIERSKNMASVPVQLRKVKSITQLGSGALIERGDLVLNQILENIEDINTEPEKDRKLVMEVTFKPSKDRDEVKLSINAFPKLAPLAPYTSEAYIGKNDDGDLQIVEAQKARELPFDDNVSLLKTLEMEDID